MKKYIGYSNSFNKASTVIALSIILGTVTYAWTGPTDTAPNGNVPAPINVGSVLQEKLGSLKVRGSFTITGGNKGYSELTQDADDESTLVTKSYVDAKIPKNCQTSLTTDSSGNFICYRAPVSSSWSTPGTYSWTAPSDVHSVNLEVVGGGGGGGAGGNDNTGAQGGWGGRGCYVSQTVSVTPNTTYSIIVGGGGNGGGHSTAMGSCSSASGGYNGGSNGLVAGGSGGGCGGGGGGGSKFDSYVMGGGGGGGGGGYITNGSPSSGANGGSGYLGGNGGSGSTGSGSSGINCDALNASPYGGSGSAGGVYPTSGGAGGSGFVKVTY